MVATDPFDLIRRVALSWVKRNRAQSQSTDWGQSLCFYGLLRAYEVTGDEAIKAHLKTWVGFHLSERLWINYFCGSWSFALLYPRIQDVFPEYRLQLAETAERLYDFITRKALRNGDGTILHNIDLPNIYIDTVYYSAVLLAKLGETLDAEWKDEGVRQIALHLNTLVDGEKPFFIHCQDNLSGQRSEGSWARGNGWVMMTFAEILPRLPKTSKEYKALQAIMTNMLGRLLPLQTRTGMWRTILDDKTAYEESSASAMFLFSLQRLVNYGILGSECNDTIALAETGLARQVDSKGRFLGASEGTWPGTVDYYKSLKTGEWWWGTGAYLLALSECVERDRARGLAKS